MNHRIGRLVHPAVPGARPFTVEDLWRIPRVGGAVPAPDGRACVVSVITHEVGRDRGCTRLWLIRSDDEPRPLTAADASAGAATWSPDGRRIAFTRTSDGDTDAKPQLYVLRLDGGEAERVVDLPLGALDARFTPDGRAIIVASPVYRDHPTLDATRVELARRREDPVKAHASEERVVRFWDRWLTGGEVPHFFLVDLDGGATRDLTPDSTGWLDFMEPRGHFDIAPDGSEIAYAIVEIDPAGATELRMRAYRVPIAGGAPSPIAPDAPDTVRRPRYTPDGAAIVHGQTVDRYFYADRARLHRFDRRTGTTEPWCVDWDRSPAQWEMAADGTLVFVAEDDARTHLYALDPDAREPRRLADGGTLGGPRPAGDAVLAVHHTMQRPPEIVRVPLAGGEATRITHFTDDAMRDVALGAVHELRLDGPSGEPVQSFVVLPPDHDEGRPAPFVNVVHGGPHGISPDGFHFRWHPHLFAAPGYVVATPNFQGSTSWGTDYARRIQGAWSDRPFEDVMAVTDALVASGVVDPERMAAAGGSYGGYMMAWIAGHTDRFRCLVNHAGVYDTLAMYATDINQGRGRSFGGEPWTDLAAIDRTNPARYATDLTTPMLVIHGELDYRVPVTQGLACYGVLKAKGVPARLLHFPDENHWILKPHNSIRWYDEVLDWMKRWISEQ